MGGDLSQYFSRREFACRCGCGFDTVDSALLVALESARQHFGSPVSINCGCRCPAHNIAVNGAPNSQHLIGRAADIVIKGVTPREVAAFFERIYPDSHGVGRYGGFTHIDSRAMPSRWTIDGGE